MKLMRSILAYLVIGIPVIMAAMTSAFSGQLAGSEWHPMKIGSIVVSQPSQMFLQFKGDGKLAGNGGCNQFFATYKILENDIQIGPMGSTRMACEQGVMELEAAFLSALENSKTFDRDKTDLTLFDKDGNVQMQLKQSDAD